MSLIPLDDREIEIFIDEQNICIEFTKQAYKLFVRNKFRRWVDSNCHANVYILLFGPDDDRRINAQWRKYSLSPNHRGILFFENKSDAILFKLVWW